MSTTVRPRDLVASATSAAPSVSSSTPARPATVRSSSRVAHASSAILCEISARSAEPLADLELIARLCARDIGQSLVVHAHATTLASEPAVITLHLPVEFAASQHPAWCLACRLACFCPQARVSVLVSAAAAFTARPSRRSHRFAA